MARRQSSPDTGKLSARPAGQPGSSLAKENLRRSLLSHSFYTTAKNNTEARTQYAFLRHGGIYPSDGGLLTKPRLEPLPPAGSSDPSPRMRREDHALLIVQMSSDRLFLDRVARQHCPSPLHRQAQTNMDSKHPGAKGDISTLPAGRHFYFAATPHSILVARKPFV